MIENTKTLINEINFDNILELINSEDDKSKVIGLTILENSDINKSYIYLLLVFNKLNTINIENKSSYNKEIIKSTVNIIDKMKHFDKNFDPSNISYKFIQDYINKNENELKKHISFNELKKCKKFILNKFSEELVDLLKKFNYNFFNEYNLIITEKT